ncbi:sensor histidine kinase [Roseateles sp. BYS180W]|uniref:histidine kinase n=1 Tax=Roseateles rivi TaxID=3299028 RepID=A0ABW7FXC4_9BURK
MFEPLELLGPDDHADTLLQTLHRAWVYRQHSPEQSQGWERRVQEQLSHTDSRTRRQCQARLLLMHAERAQLQLESELCQQQSRQAYEQFELLDDLRGCSDALWPQALLQAELGQVERAVLLLQQAAELALRAGDPARAHLAAQEQAALLAYVDLPRSESLAKQFGPLRPEYGPANEAAALFAQMRWAIQHGRVAECTAPGLRAFELAQRNGQRRLAVTLCSALCYSAYGAWDFEQAFAWIERGHQLCAGLGWPALHAQCDMRLGQLLLHAGQNEKAADVLQHALHNVQAYPHLREYAGILEGLACAHYSSGRYDMAEPLLLQVRHWALLNQQPEMETEALVGLTHIHLGRGQWGLAANFASMAWQSAQDAQDWGHAVIALYLLSRSTLERTDLSAEAKHQLMEQHFAALQKAQTKASGLILKPSYYSVLSDYYATCGDHARAFEIERQARQAAQHAAEATNNQQALSLMARIEHRRMEAEAAKLKSQNEARRERIALLEQEQNTLARLAAVGQRITAQLNIEALGTQTNTLIRELLPVDSILIYRTDPNGEQLLPLQLIEDGMALSGLPIALSHPHSSSARCARQLEVLVQEAAANQARLDSEVPGASPMASAMHAPLQVGSTLVGVMSLQTRQAHAYGARERTIFSALSSYVAIALANAVAHQNTQQLQRKLADQEKLASLGSLVAGVAHELNTPIGNSLLVSTTLQDHTRHFGQQLGAGALSKRALTGLLESLGQGLDVVQRNLHTAARLVNSFKQLAVNRQVQDHCSFDLPELCQQCVHTLSHQLRRQHVQVVTELPEALRLFGHAGSLSQVLIILLENALIHGIGERSDGVLRLSVQQRDHPTLPVLLELSDNGKGMPPEVQQRIFEPFFTTRFGQGGSGLGLSIAHNLVVEALQGDITVHSSEGQGTRFCVALPLHARANASAA